MHQFRKFIFGMKLYMFRTVHLSIIKSLFTVHSAVVYVIQLSSRTRMELQFHPGWNCSSILVGNRGELSYLAPLGSKIFPPLISSSVSFGGGGYYPPDWVKHHASQSQDKFTLMFINEGKRNANTHLISNFESVEASPSNLPP